MTMVLLITKPPTAPTPALAKAAAVAVSRRRWPALVVTVVVEAVASNECWEVDRTEL